MSFPVATVTRIQPAAFSGSDYKNLKDKPDPDSSSERTSELTDLLSLGAEDVDVHGGEDVGVDDALFCSGLLPAGVDGVGVPVGPEQSVLVQGEGERVRQLSFNHHLPETHSSQTSNTPSHLHILTSCYMKL